MDELRASRIAKELNHTPVGGWVISEEYHAGKSAIVFKATKGADIAAVKVFDPDLIDRFGTKAQEARIERELTLRDKHHPNLVGIRGGGYCERSNYWFVVMDYIDAPTVATLLQVISRESIWRLISQVASAARFLEEMQLAHRDIKPDNIAVHSSIEKAVLLDLGVVRPFGLGTLTDEDQLTFIGTLQYSSPEFLFRKEIDSLEGWRAVSFYQLGAVLHDLIMRKRLFSEFAEPYARLVQAVQHEVPNVEAADVSPDLILLTKNCLLKDPDLRLRFVNWKDFNPPEDSGPAVLRAKERIRRRQGLSQESLQGKQGPNSSQLARRMSRILRQIQIKLEEVVRQECVGSELFPPIEMDEFTSEETKKAGFVILVKASEEHSLSYALSVLFEIELLEAQSKAVSLSIAAALSDGRLTREALLAGARSKFFEGVFQEAAIDELVQKLLYLLLDQAQQIDRNLIGLPEDAIKWLLISENS